MQAEIMDVQRQVREQAETIEHLAERVTTLERAAGIERPAPTIEPEPFPTLPETETAPPPPPGEVTP